MKLSIFRSFLMCALFLPILTACGDGKLDLDNPSAVADFLCEKTEAMFQAAADEEQEEVDAILAEVRKNEEDLRAHHGSGFPDFMALMEAELTSNCELSAPNFSPPRP